MRKEGLWVVSHLMNEVERLTQERDAWKADAERLAGCLRDCKALFGKAAKALRSDGPLPMDELISEVLQMGADTEWASLTAHDALKSQGEPEAAEGKEEEGG